MRWGTPELAMRDRDALVDAIQGRVRQGRQVVMLVGAGVNMPFVPGVNGIIDLIREYVARFGGNLLDFEREIAGVGAARYQAALEHLGRVYGQEAVNWIVRRAVLSARTDSSASSMVTSALGGDPTACERLLNDCAGWHLTAGVAALGRLAAHYPHVFGRCVLTSNFDPLIEVSIRRAGGHCYSVPMQEDGLVPPLDPAICNVVHFHGDWYRSDTLHTPVQLGQDRTKLARSLRHLLDSRTLLVMGYGGWDDILTRALIEVAETGDGKPDVIWTFFETQVRTIQLQHHDLIETLGGLGGRGRLFFYKGIDIHALMPALLDRLGHAESSSAGVRGGRPSTPLPPEPGPVAAGAEAGAGPSFDGPALATHAEQEPLLSQSVPAITTSGARDHRMSRRGKFVLASVLSLLPVAALARNVMHASAPEAKSAPSSVAMAPAAAPDPPRTATAPDPTNASEPTAAQKPVTPSPDEKIQADTIAHVEKPSPALTSPPYIRVAGRTPPPGASAHREHPAVPKPPNTLPVGAPAAVETGAASEPDPRTSDPCFDNCNRLLLSCCGEAEMGDCLKLKTKCQTSRANCVSKCTLIH